MKKIIFMFAALLFAVYVQAQDIAISNTSCQDIMIDISADQGCEQKAQSVPYKIPRKGTLKLSMFPGGTYPVINWSWGTVTPGYQFTAVKVYNAPTDPVVLGYLFNPCWGSPNFTTAVPCGTMNGSSTGWSTPLVIATVN